MHARSVPVESRVPPEEGWAGKGKDEPAQRERVQRGLGWEKDHYVHVIEGASVSPLVAVQISPSKPYGSTRKPRPAGQYQVM